MLKSISPPISNRFQLFPNAFNMIMEQLPRQYERNDRDSHCEQIIIKYENAGRLIGKGGQTIKSISEETGTMVSFPLWFHL